MVYDLLRGVLFVSCLAGKLWSELGLMRDDPVQWYQPALCVKRTIQLKSPHIFFQSLHSGMIGLFIPTTEGEQTAHVTAGTVIAN